MDPKNCKCMSFTVLCPMSKLCLRSTFGVLKFTQVCAPLLVSSKGSIINVSSVGGSFPNPFRGGGTKPAK
jgi:NAD(P)-dependent dehydrogenase (short-subunit alcohol dehydrogenase family)